MNPGTKLKVVDSYSSTCYSFRKGDILTFQEFLIPTTDYIVLEEFPSVAFSMSHFEEVKTDEKIV